MEGQAAGARLRSVDIAGRRAAGRSDAWTGGARGGRRGRGGGRAGNGEQAGRGGGVVAIIAGYGVFALLIGLWLGGGQPEPATDGLPTAGAFVAWALPLTQLAKEAFATLTVGMLLAAAVLVRPAGGGLGETGLRCVRAAVPFALAWAGCSGFALALSLADFMTVPLPRLGTVDGLAGLAWSLGPARALLIVTVTAAVVAVGSRLVRGTGGAVALLVVAAFGLLPPVYAGHAATATDHTVAISGMMVHVLAVAVWVGGLAAIVFRLRRAHEELPVAVARFSRIALGCYVAAAVSGLAGAWVRLGSVDQLWTTPYGLLLTGKVVLLAVLGYIGWLHRSTTIAKLRRGRSAWPFLRLAAGELAVMAAAIGLAVALARTAPPVLSEEVTAARVFLGYELRPLGLVEMLTRWRPDPLPILAVLGAGLAYLPVMRRARWPRRRTICWFGGLAVLLVAFTGGVAAYAPALFSVWAVQHVLIGVVAPVLLVCGSPAVPEAIARRVSRPAVVLAGYALPPFAFYLTGLFELAQSSHAVHLIGQAVFLFSGLLFFWVTLRGPLELPVRRLLVLASAPMHAVLALSLVLGPPIAEKWYTGLRLPWAAAPALDQRLGGALLGVLGVLVLVGVLLALRRRRPVPVA
jgi:putative copper resistance protein D